MQELEKAEVRRNDDFELTHVDTMTDQELAELPMREIFIFDVETYRNLFYVAFMHRSTGKVVHFDLSKDFNFNKLAWMLRRFTFISFNGLAYDIPMLAAAMCGLTMSQLKDISDEIIQEQLNRWALEKKYQHKEKSGRKFNFDWAKVDHIDLIEVCPLSGSLKIYAGRLHGDRMQDLPYPPDAILTEQQIEYTKNYCANDLRATNLIYENLGEQLALREQMSKEYGTDLRSKSDAQIAEAVIGGEIKKITGQWPSKVEFQPGGKIKYRMPEFINFQTHQMRDIARKIAAADFPLSDSGNPQWPDGLGERVKNSKGELVWALSIPIGGSVYRMGMGGLHSSEKCIAHVAGPDTVLADHDVESYYPRMIINQSLYPKHLGKVFLQVFEGIVDRRVKAKRSGDKSTANSLKIVINGTFGKLGSRYSIFFSPDLLAQVTISGQLSLLMLIERLELSGISVVSANTDGIVLKLRPDQLPLRDKIIAQWESDCNYVTEETRYVGLYSRDVNNYIAIKQAFDYETKAWLNKADGIKTKGAYANPWSSAKPDIFRFHKNPQSTICISAVERFLIDRVPVNTTVRTCSDIRQFVALTAVQGGAHKDGRYLGKAVRWYYSTKTATPIQRMNGNQVPTSIGAMPVQDLPKQMPADIDFGWYEREANDMLMQIGCTFDHQPERLF